MTTVNADNDAIVQTGLGQANNSVHNNVDDREKDSYDDSSEEDTWSDKPTPEEMKTLRRVSGKIKWSMWTIAFVELCERFSYYGSSVLYTNFVVHPLPPGSTTGAPKDPGNSNVAPGVLGEGPKAGQGISLFNTFFAYIMPLFG